MTLVARISFSSSLDSQLTMRLRHVLLFLLLIVLAEARRRTKPRVLARVDSDSYAYQKSVRQKVCGVGEFVNDRGCRSERRKGSRLFYRRGGYSSMCMNIDLICAREKGNTRMDCGIQG